MNITTTFVAVAACLLLTVAFGWMGARTARPGRVRLTPWRFMMVLAFTATVAVAVHLVTLFREGAGQEPAAQGAFVKW